MTELLEVRGVRAGFGSTTVLHGVDFSVRQGEIAGIFGLNGAGKSVTMKVLAGLVPAWSGTITFDGTDITKLTPEKRVAMGMGHVPQGRQVFPALTVEENLRLGAYVLRRNDRSRYASALANVYDRFPKLGQRRDQLAGTMSGGEQASLAVARALINDPKLVLVDEPSAGLAPIVVHELYETLREVASTGVTMVLVEQNVAFGLELANRAHILQLGRVVHEGSVGDLDQETLARHLGIGRMLGSATSKALSNRQPAGDRRQLSQQTLARRAARAARRTAAANGGR